MPKQYGQDAESILDQTAAQKKATSSQSGVKFANPFQIPLIGQGAFNGGKLPSGVSVQYRPSNAQTIALPQGAGFNQQTYMSPREQAMLDRAKMNAESRIPLPANPGIRPDPQLTLDTPLGTGMNLKPEDYQNIAGKSALDILAMYMPRAEIDSRFPGGVTEEDAMNYLLDNYSWLFPERTGAMPTDTTGGTGTGTGSGGYEAQIPLPDYGGWGGGGYGEGYRDSGLINWRI